MYISIVFTHNRSCIQSTPTRPQIPACTMISTTNTKTLKISSELFDSCTYVYNFSSYLTKTFRLHQQDKLFLFREINGICCANHKKYVDIFYRQSTEVTSFSQRKILAPASLAVPVSCGLSSIVILREKTAP